ncbi:glutamyl-tRNA synthetase [Flavobacterium seoulense]|uniref:ATPase n=1 Tax=Flavobacterium seoulense TaxID=1492738 RepID=A0A066WJW6_9FLAO|nr:glutamyl-tRNA synthetase [Flavobacterium seoulense]KDN54151.1 ATPase [Flavobacterium seoulense]
MNSSNFIYRKLEAFIRKYYLNELIRGSVFFIGLGLLYFLFTLFIEYFLWLKPIGRTFLFWAFVGVEAFLLFRFILFPVFKLFKFQKGIDYNEASSIIGNHFSDVKDKLLNFIQLSNPDNNSERSELLLASIEQKANALQPIPFSNAIDFKSNKKYVPLALIPVLVFASFYISGNNSIISQSFNRVVNFDASFLPPAPFEFVLLNSNLQTEQNKNFTLKVKTIGKVVPENVMIFIDNESYFMENLKPGEFEFKIEKPIQDISFHLEGNTVSSKDYILKVVAVPSILNFEMQLNFPSHLNRKAEIVKGTGNAIIPEGTLVTWKMSTLATQKVVFSNANAVFPFSKSENNFFLAKKINENTDYQIITSNNSVANFEKLNYQLSVVKDQFPSISVNQAPDSLKLASNYLLGKIADDNGLSKLQVVYYESNKPTTAKRGTIAIKKGVFDQFVFSFPSNLPVVEGTTYDYYFEVFDNDVLHNFKSSKSAVFSNRIITAQEKQDLLLVKQSDNIQGLQQSLKNQDKQFSQLDKIQKTGKEKENFEFKDQQKINDFIQQQKKQDQMMRDFMDKMKNNLEESKAKSDDEFKKELENRLDKNSEEIEKNKKLLDELKSLNDKIKNEDFLDKLDQFKQKSKNQVKNLQQLVELTKKYYVQKKAEQIADKLDKLANKQDKIAEDEKENKLSNQQQMNKDFDKIKEDLNDLEKQNKDLKSPLDIPNDDTTEKSIDEDLKKAAEELKNNSSSKAKPKQKSAAKKMKAMSMKMDKGMEGAEMEQMEEDVKMLRQILDNLLAFSLSEEDVMKGFKSLNSGSPAFNKKIKLQQDLRMQFKHVDDSLFAMSLRNPKMTEEITKEVGNVQYNLDKALEKLTDSQISRGVSHQQYAVASANKLGDFLSELLNNMQMSLSSMGAGKPKPGQGEGMQLPDIISKQEALGNKIRKGMKPGDANVGKDGKGNSGEGGDGEGDAKAIMDIYKEQKELRDALEKELNKQGLGNQGQSAVEQMKQLEKQLLNRGFKNETMQRVLNLKQELLKLNNALQQQGEENKRQSNSNLKDFSNQSKPLPNALIDYLNSIEILNRQSLPLRSNFNRKVQEYFKTK